MKRLQLKTRPPRAIYPAGAIGRAVEAALLWAAMVVFASSALGAQPGETQGSGAAPIEAAPPAGARVSDASGAAYGGAASFMESGASAAGPLEPDPRSIPDEPEPEAQTSAQTAAPAAAGQPPQQAGAADTEQRQPQTSRILDVIPNFRAVSTDQKLPPMSVKDKFVGATEDSFDYSAIFIPLLLAGYSDATKATPEFGHGAAAYARYFWHTAVDQTSENYMVEFIVPVIAREDPRYYTLGRGGFLKRAGYALSRTVVTRNDKNGEEFNFSEVVGAGASAGISTLYYPSKERSLGSVGSEWGIDVAIDAMSFVVKEFWPDVNHALFHRHDLAAASR